MVLVKLTFQGSPIAQAYVDRSTFNPPVFWQGDMDGVKCDTCSVIFSTTFYDMKLAGSSGQWACICPSCAMGGQGIGKVGLGFGQRYDRKENGWMLTAGGK